MPMASTSDLPQVEHYFEDLPVPDKIWPHAHTVTREEVVAMASRCEPLDFHLDKRTAAQIGAPDLIAPSVLTPAPLVKLIHMNTPPASVDSASNQDEVRFLTPVYVGDVLRLKTPLVEKREKDSLPDQRLVRTRFSLINQNGIEVFSTINSVWFRKRAVPRQLAGNLQEPLNLGFRGARTRSASPGKKTDANI